MLRRSHQTKIQLIEEANKRLLGEGVEWWKRLNLLFFTNPDWCAPCKKVEPGIDKLIEKGVKIKKFIVDDFKEPEIKKYDIPSIPTLVFFDSSGTKVLKKLYANEIPPWMDKVLSQIP